MRQIAQLTNEKKRITDLTNRIDELVSLADLALDEQDTSLETQLADEFSALEKDFDELRIQIQLRGEYDKGAALLSIKAGAGGIDAQDWAEMLFRMYARWAERSDYKTTILDYGEGEEAGIKSATARIEGLYAYGYLNREAGIHRLVRQSPFDSGHRRHTSFALVEVLPVIENAEFTIDPKDVEYDFFKASGHGGQSVQKNSTAVRLKHLPSGITISVQNERSQMQNKEIALKILETRLAELEHRKRQAKTDELKGTYKPAEFGNQARSYVMHPYQMVRDHRTEHKESDVAKILDGELDGFIKSLLEKSAANSG